VKKQVKKQAGISEEALLSNLTALLSELKVLANNEDNYEESMEDDSEEGIQMEDDSEEGIQMEDDSEEDVEKGLEQTQSETSTANANAGDRDEENLPDGTKENTSVLAKDFINTLLNNKVLNKRKSKNSIEEEFKNLTKVVKSVIQTQKENQKVIEEILSGIGVAKAIEEIKSEEKIKKSKKEINNNLDLPVLIEFIQKAAGGKDIKFDDSNLDSSNPKDMARKSIASWLPNVLKDKRR